VSKLATADCDSIRSAPATSPGTPPMATRGTSICKPSCAPLAGGSEGQRIRRASPTPPAATLPTQGGRHGTSLSFMQKQLPIRTTACASFSDPPGDNGQSYQTGVWPAFCHAMNECVLHAWLEPEPRLKGSSSCLIRTPTRLMVRVCEKYGRQPAFAHGDGSADLATAGQNVTVKLVLSGRRGWSTRGCARVRLWRFPGHGFLWRTTTLKHGGTTPIESGPVSHSMVIEGVFELIPYCPTRADRGRVCLAAVPAPGGWTRSGTGCRMATPHLNRLPSEYFKSGYLPPQPMEGAGEARASARRDRLDRLGSLCSRPTPRTGI